MKNYHEYIDIYGVPVTIKGDGGDSCAEAGTMMTLAPETYRFSRDLFIKPGGPVRHPNNHWWYGRSGRFSRDQLIPFLCSLIMAPDNDLAEDLYLLHKRKRFMFAWNKIRNFQYETIGEQINKAPQVKWNPWPKTPDFTGPEVWALWLRMWPRWWKWPLICLLDLETLIGSIIWKFRKDGISRNHLLVLYVGTSVCPTPVMWLARWLTDVNHLAYLWGAHCRRTGAIDTSELFYRAFRR